MDHHPSARSDVPVRLGERAHVVQFYEDERHLVQLVARFLGVGLVNRAPLFAIVTERHRKALCTRLSAIGFDVEDVCAASQLRFLDVHETLERILVAGMPDRERVQAVLGAPLKEMVLHAPGRQARVFGEMVDVLWSDGRAEAALRLEEQWNDMQARLPFSLLCSYCMSDADLELHPVERDRICGAHTRTLGVARSSA